MARVVERSSRRRASRSSPAPASRTSRPAPTRSSSPTATRASEVDYLVHRRRPRRRRRRARPRRRRAEARRRRQDRRRRRPEDVERRRLRDRRHHARPGARAQGPGGGHRRRRDDRRAADAPDRPRRDPRRDLHPSAGRQRRPDRGGGQGGRPRRQDRRSSSSAASEPAPSTTTATAWSSSSSTRKYGEILGAHIVGNRACDMIAELVAVKELEGGYQELAADHPSAPDDLRGDPGGRPGDRQVGHPRVEDNRRLLRARDLIDRCYAEPLDIVRSPRSAHVSRHFIRSFRAAFGETPHRYLQRRRVERAMELLREPTSASPRSASRSAS